jgi:hypothetical protein
VATDQQARIRLERLGGRLQWATIAWNSIEVFITIGLGIAAGSLALIAFGLGSLIEVFASLVVIWHMNPGVDGHHARRDRRALRLVGLAFAMRSLPTSRSRASDNSHRTTNPTHHRLESRTCSWPPS